MGTTADGGKGSKGRAANGDRPMGAARSRREQHTKGDVPNPPFRKALQSPLRPQHMTPALVGPGWNPKLDRRGQ